MARKRKYKVRPPISPGQPVIDAETRTGAIDVGNTPGTP